MPVETIPEDQRDPEAAIRDAKQLMDEAEAAYQQARNHWLDLNEQAGHPILQAVRWN